MDSWLDWRNTTAREAMRRDGLRVKIQKKAPDLAARSALRPGQGQKSQSLEWEETKPE